MNGSIDMAKWLKNTGYLKKPNGKRKSEPKRRSPKLYIWAIPIYCRFPLFLIPPLAGPSRKNPVSHQRTFFETQPTFSLVKLSRKKTHTHTHSFFFLLSEAQHVVFGCSPWLAMTATMTFTTSAPLRWKATACWAASNDLQRCHCITSGEISCCPWGINANVWGHEKKEEHVSRRGGFGLKSKLVQIAFFFWVSFVFFWGHSSFHESYVLIIQCLSNVLRTVMMFLNRQLDVDTTARVWEFLGPGCDLQLIALPKSEDLGRKAALSKAMSVDEALKSLYTLYRSDCRGKASKCCGIWLSPGLHRARARVQFPVTIQGPKTLESKLVASEWTVAAEYLGLKSLKLEPPDCIRSDTFHTLLKVCTGNLWLSDCEIQAQTLSRETLARTTGKHCIKVHKAARVTVAHCNFSSTNQAALDLRSQSASIVQCSFKNCNSAIDSRGFEHMLSTLKFFG